MAAYSFWFIWVKLESRRDDLLWQWYSIHARYGRYDSNLRKYELMFSQFFGQPFLPHGWLCYMFGMGWDGNKYLYWWRAMQILQGRVNWGSERKVLLRSKRKQNQSNFEKSKTNICYLCLRSFPFLVSYSFGLNRTDRIIINFLQTIVWFALQELIFKQTKIYLHSPISLSGTHRLWICTWTRKKAESVWQKVFVILNKKDQNK